MPYAATAKTASTEAGPRPSNTPTATASGDAGSVLSADKHFGSQ
jgi:hypothetical protein